MVPVFAGGLDFSLPVKKFFYDPLRKCALPLGRVVWVSDSASAPGIITLGAEALPCLGSWRPAGHQELLPVPDPQAGATLLLIAGGSLCRP